MLTEVADDVLVRQSAFCQSNAVVIHRPQGALLVDPGVDGSDLTELADDLDRLGVVVTAGFSTHPHWDHLLWHARFGDVPRYAAAQCAATADERSAKNRDMAARLAPSAPLDLLGRLTALPTGSDYLPWDGREIRIIEHRAHAPGHAALVIEDCGVLLAGDMLSDVEIPLLDPQAADPSGDYSSALELFAAIADGVTAVVPGHGGIAFGTEVRSRIATDWAYVQSLQNGIDPADPRIGPLASYGTDWLPEAHLRNQQLARS